MCTSRSLRVSDSMQPLLGRPRRTWVRSGTLASDCCNEAQHTKTVRLKGKEGVEAERHGWSITDIAFSREVLFLKERKREVIRRFGAKVGKNK